jgi:hypothetical protein
VITAADLNRAYQAWCIENNERPMSPRGLGLELRKRGFTPEREPTAKRTRLWRGVEVADES